MKGGTVETIERPIYETKADRDIARSIAERVCKGRDWFPIETPPLHPIDFFLADPRIPFAALEVKRRRCSRGRYPDIIISKNKIDNAVEICEDHAIPLLFAVEFTEGIFIAELFTIPKCRRFVLSTESSPFRFRISTEGRTDRGDPMDRELCYMIPTVQFIPANQYGGKR